MAEECPLCGGELVEHEILAEREEKLKEHDADLGDLHAYVCSHCGHVSYHQQH